MVIFCYNWKIAPGIYEQQWGEAMRFLLIDDEPQIGSVIRRVAEGCGFQVETTTDADTFKAACRSFQPDVIGLDLAIPGCDGIELISYLADANSRAAVVVISGLGGQMLDISCRLGEARGLKMGGVISKPIRIAEIRALLDKLSQAA
ncbi:MAG: hypothetical protein JWM91_4174 [Rhodospirillales bacterium]|nr:hypothetical protein [Rhodospirillales bacterium]